MEEQDYERNGEPTPPFGPEPQAEPKTYRGILRDARRFLVLKRGLYAIAPRHLEKASSDPERVRKCYAV